MTEQGQDAVLESINSALSEQYGLTAVQADNELVFQAADEFVKQAQALMLSEVATNCEPFVEQPYSVHRRIRNLSGAAWQVIAKGPVAAPWRFGLAALATVASACAVWLTVYVAGSDDLRDEVARGATTEQRWLVVGSVDLHAKVLVAELRGAGCSATAAVKGSEAIVRFSLAHRGCDSEGVAAKSLASRGLAADLDGRGTVVVLTSPDARELH